MWIELNNNNNNKNNIYRGYHQANTKFIRVVLYLQFLVNFYLFSWHMPHQELSQLGAKVFMWRKVICLPGLVRQLRDASPQETTRPGTFIYTVVWTFQRRREKLTRPG